MGAKDDERNRFLTVAMGECWHDLDLGRPVLTCKGGGFICGKCRDFVVANNDFATGEDFSKLWNWIQSVPELRERLADLPEPSSLNKPLGRGVFADIIYEAIKKLRIEKGDQ
jgi:hypothetical protein